MDESETDKSEAATPFKLKRARERGSVARSIDLGFFAALAATLGFVWMGAEELVEAMAFGAREALAVASTIGGSPEAYGEVFARAAAPAVRHVLMFAVALFGIALLLDFVQVGPVFTATPLKPDFGRINPAKGLRRIFSLRALIEAVKAVLKLAVYAVVAWLVIKDALETVANSATDGKRLAGAMLALSTRLLMGFALVALAFALLDQGLVRREFAKRMRMSRREVKREFRDREGDPRFKQKRKQLHGELAKAVQALLAVRGSDVIIVNPTHYAVALRFDRAHMTAPLVVARGAGELARRIRRIGFTYGVLTIYDPPLARALHRLGRIDGEIPPLLYQQVADIYLRHGLAGDGADTTRTTRGLSG